MKTTKEILNFCNEFTVYVYYNIDRVIELNYVRDYIIIVFSKCDHIDECFQIGALDVIDVLSLMVVDNVENHFQERKKLKVGFLQLPCLEKLYKEETDKWMRKLVQ